MYASIVAANGFFIDLSQDFSDWDGTTGDQDYMIVAKDSGDDVGWGYIGEMGSGETLGAELVTASDDRDFTVWGNVNWTADSGASIADGTGKAEYTLDGSGISLMLLTGSYIDPITEGALYKLDFNFWQGTSNSTDWKLYDGFANFLASGNFDGTEATVHTAYFTDINDLMIIELRVTDSDGGTVYLDDVSVQEVTDPATTTGVKIYSTKDGSTQSFAGTTDFDANDISSYEIRKTDFQITGALTVGAWIKGAGQNNIAIIDKYSWENNMRSWSVESTTTGDYDKLRIILSDDGGWNAGHRMDYRSSITVFDDTWHYFAFTFDSGTLKLYIDGTEDTNVTKSQDDAITTLYDTRYPLYLSGIMNSGTGNMGNLFNGAIQSPFIYNRALTATEITDLYNSQKSKFIE